MEIFERLKSERERIQLSQPRVAELANVGKTTVINWEKGASAPDAVQLSALAAAGIDVLFVITGQRSQGLPPAATLPPDQQVLVSNYERCKPEGKQHLIQTSALMSAGLSVTTAAATPKRGAKQPTAASTGGMSMDNSGSGNQQVGHAGGDVQAAGAIKAGGDVIAPGVVSASASRSFFALPIAQVNIRKKE